ncbi:MAG: DnaD domain protein [Eubacterium sp.]|nr:DnaD domain protein [Eubacterium sp.]
MTSEIHLHDNSSINATYVPNAFIDTYLAAAPGDYVKVYLYLLRCLNGGNSFSIRKIADIFEYTEGDVKRALKYWEKVNMLNLEFNESGELAGIFFHYGSGTGSTAKSPEAPKAQPKEKSLKKDAAVPAKRNYSSKEISEFAGTEAGEQLIYLAELYTGKTLSPDDIATIYYWKMQLEFSPDLIEYLIENCVSHKVTTVRNMDKTALYWYYNNVTTRKEAKKLPSADADSKSVVVKALGIKGRDLNEWECEYIRKWTCDWKFGDSIIKEACRRTIANTHQPSFEYTDSILANWHSEKASSMAEIIALDDAHKAKSAEKAKKAPSAKTPNSKFNNFTSRNYDYDDIERLLLTN